MKFLNEEEKRREEGRFALEKEVHVLQNIKDKERLSKKHPLNLKPLLKIDFRDDFEELLTIFPEEDTVIAMISTLENSPEEIQIIAKMILDLHKKIDNICED